MVEIVPKSLEDLWSDLHLGLIRSESTSARPREIRRHLMASMFEREDIQWMENDEWQRKDRTKGFPPYRTSDKPIVKKLPFDTRKQTAKHRSSKG